MTTKELLYVEDALGHEQQMNTVLTNFGNKIEDPELRNLVFDLTQKHKQTFMQFYSLLEK